MKKKLSVLLLAALLAALCLLNSCNPSGEGDASLTDTAPITPEQTEVPADLIAGNGATEYRFVRADGCSATFKSNYSAFASDVCGVTGIKFTVTTDWINPNDASFDPAGPEILVGNTARAETAAVLAVLPADSWTIRRVGKKLVVLGADDNLTTLAMQAFITDVLGSPAHFSDGKLTFAEGDEISGTLSHPLDLPYLMSSGLKFTTVSNEVLHCLPVDEYCVTQGCCSDGTFVYFILRQTVDSACKICKYRLDDYSLVSVSGALPLNHGSDVTYDAKNNRLVVARGNTEGKMLGFVDPDRLVMKGNQDITNGAGAITYNEKLNRYVIGQGGSTWILLDENFAVLKKLDRTTIDKATSRGYITQGLGSDDEFVYFPMNMTGNTENILVAYTWEGEYVGDVTVPVAMESESMFVANGEYYISFYKNKDGAFLHKLSFNLEYESPLEKTAG